MTFTCTYEEDAVPCESAPDFFYLNENLGVPTQLFLTDNDVEKGNELILKRKDAGVREVKDIKRITTRVTSRATPRVTPAVTSVTSEPASEETPVILLNQVDGRPQEDNDLNNSAPPRIQNVRQAKNGQGRRPRRKNQKQNQRN